jgi:hypothetical protein
MAQNIQRQYRRHRLRTNLALRIAQRNQFRKRMSAVICAWRTRQTVNSLGSLVQEFVHSNNR